MGLQRIMWVTIIPGKDIGDRVFPRLLAQFVSIFYSKRVSR